MSNQSYGTTAFNIIIAAMVSVLGFLTVKYLSSIDQNFQSINEEVKNINKKFESFMLSYHLVDKRLDKVEYRTDELEKRVFIPGRR